MEYNTSFTVYPGDCNPHKNPDGSMMVHGGTMLLKMDRAAAACVKRALYNTECDTALTVGVDKVTFFFGAKLGDLINISAKVIDVGLKRITCQVSCFVEEWGGSQKVMAEGLFHFCSFKEGESEYHRIKLNGCS